jgi:hypothetical protein
MQVRYRIVGLTCICSGYFVSFTASLSDCIWILRQPGRLNSRALFK